MKPNAAKVDGLFRQVTPLFLLGLLGMVVLEPLAPAWLVETFGDDCLLYTSPSPRDLSTSRMPSSA